MGIGSKPCLDIRPSQNQINDRSISFSQMGKLLLRTVVEGDDSDTSLLSTAPKFRNSFMSVASTEIISKNRRPNSIVSVNSLSSGTSSSSGSCSGNTNRNTSGLNMGQQIEEEATDPDEMGSQVAEKANKFQNSSGVGGRKGYNHSHHRSTTLVSQCSMGNEDRKSFILNNILNKCFPF